MFLWPIYVDTGLIGRNTSPSYARCVPIIPMNRCCEVPPQRHCSDENATASAFPVVRRRQTGLACELHRTENHWTDSTNQLSSSIYSRSLRSAQSRKRVPGFASLIFHSGGRLVVDYCIRVSMLLCRSVACSTRRSISCGCSIIKCIKLINTEISNSCWQLI